jgi:2-keto-4-pentenoate hydratase/2-oxohepta-3-ene-1,7-dioic acid hydratase in catechol pathway
MKIVRFKTFEKVYYGILENNKILALSSAPWENGKENGDVYLLDDITLLAPCEPKKIIGVAINFPGATGLATKFKEPLVFLKPSTSLIGTNDNIVSPFIDINVWGECELAIVIGKKLHKASELEAKNGIFGYTIGNDVSCDNIQDWDHHLARSKGADTFCSLGPWIETEYSPNEKIIRGYQNGELLRQGLATDRLFAEPDLLVWLSKWMTLEPGDVILTGAPTRVRERLFLNDGDTFVCEIDGLGKLENSYRTQKNV